LENLIEKQPELAQDSEGRVAWEGDALHQSLGRGETWTSTWNGIASDS